LAGGEIVKRRKKIQKNLALSADWSGGEPVLRLRFPGAGFRRVMVHLPQPAEREYIKDVRIRRGPEAAVGSQVVV